MNQICKSFHDAIGVGGIAKCGNFFCNYSKTTQTILKKNKYWVYTELQGLEKTSYNKWLKNDFSYYMNYL